MEGEHLDLTEQRADERQLDLEAMFALVGQVVEDDKIG